MIIGININKDLKALEPSKAHLLVKRMVAVVGLMLMMAMLVVQAHPQASTTTVQGIVYLADGSVASGTLQVSWPAFTTTAGQAVAAGSESATIGSNGSLNVNLVANSGATPAGTYYTAVYHLNGGTVSQEYWVVPAATSVSLSSVQAQLAPATVAVQTVSKSYVDSSIAAITGNYVPLAGGTMNGPLQLSGSPVSANQAATKQYADTLAAALLPLTGGNLSGTLNTPNLVSKLPRVDVRDPDFGTGCTNAADPTGQQDSTCAIEAAVAFASATAQQEGNGIAPALYFPHGIYKISSDPRVPCGIPIIGDGANSSIIEEVNNGEGFTIIGEAWQPNAEDCNGSMRGLSFYTPNGHNYVATQLQILSSTGYTLRDIRISGGGGRGLALLGSTERTDAEHIEIDTVRWPLIWINNENHLRKLNIAGPGESGDGYCFGTGNCVNGVYPNQGWTGGTLISANANGSTAYFYIRGSATAFKETSPLVVGHHFTVSGTTGIVLDGLYTVTAVTNNVTSDPSGGCTTGSPCFEIAGASTVSGTATVSGASWLPTILPDRNAAVYAEGQDWEIQDGSIKSLWYAGGIEVQAADAGRISDIYFEGYPENGQPHLDSDIVDGGLPPVTTLTAAMPSTGAPVAVPAANLLWFHGFVNDDSDVSTAGGYSAAVIEPQDFVKGSTTPSAYVSGVEQGQVEYVNGEVTTDGEFHITTRNESGSTAPTNTAWPAGSILAETAQGSDYGPIVIESNHLNAVDAAGAAWATDCVDNSTLICAEIIGGTIPNGYSVFTYGQGSGGERANMIFVGGDWWTGGAEAIGVGYIKARGAGANVEVISNEPTFNAYGNGAATGQFLLPSTGGGSPGFINVQEADGSYPGSTYTKPEDGTYFNATAEPDYTKILDEQENYTLEGTNPNSSYAFGRQFTNSWCDYDTPASGQTHSANRFCIKGTPNNTGTNAGWEYDEWNGSTWVNAFGISAQSNSTANAAVSGSLAAASYEAQIPSGSQNDAFQSQVNGASPFFNLTYEGTIKSNGGIALNTVINTASTMALTTGNKNVIANAASGAQTIMLPSCSTVWPDKASPAGLEFTIIKSDASSNAVTIEATGSEKINYAGAFATSLLVSSPGERTLICAPDYNWYAY
ncbi:MAG: glycosyl hydrolase family 28-related protein [Silvibacterium sp.]